MKNLNIKDIAKLAGVGVSTVSRVINDHPDVKKETRLRVLDIIKEHNYIPNNSARNLKLNESKNIGVLVKGAFNPFFSEIIQHIEDKIDDEGYSMMLHYNENNDNDIEVAIELIKEKRLKGLICLGGDFNSLEDSQLMDLNTPIILSSTEVMETVDKSFFSSVIIENEKSAYNACSYLCELGHKKIGIISTGVEDRCVGTLRFNGYLRALEEKDIMYDERYFEIGEYTFQSGFDAMSRLLEKDIELTAVFVTSDIMAIGAAKAILSRGLRIPEDISIIGFDGIDYAKYFHPSIATIKQPVEGLGKQSVDILFKIINKGAENKHIVLQTELLEGESCRRL